MNEQDYKAEIARLKEQNERLLAREQAINDSPIGFKVGDKGTLVISGLGGTWPVNLWKEAARRLFSTAQVARVNAFLDAHDAEFKSRGETADAYAKRRAA